MILSKKIAIVITAVALLLLLNACNGSPAEPESVASTTIIEESEPIAPEEEIETPIDEEGENVENSVEATAVPTAQPTPEAEPTSWLIEQLPSLGEAPEITNEVWINSEPLTLAELEGQVVLIEFWTYG